MTTRRLLVLTASVAACSGGASNDDLDSGPLVQVAEVTSAHGGYQVALLAHAPTPVRGIHSLELIIDDATTGAPVDGLALAIVPWMPAMGHGTEIIPDIAPLGSGAYALTEVDLFMPGTWQIRTSLGSDSAAPELQVE